MKFVGDAFFVLAVIAFLGSLFARRFGSTERSDVLRGLAFLLLLPALGIRTYGYFNPPTAEEVFAERFGPRTPEHLFGRRFVKAAPGATFYDLVLEPKYESGPLLLYGAGEDVISLGKWASRHPSSRVDDQDVTLSLAMNLLDQYGARSRHEVLTLRWSGEDWKRIAWDTVTPELVIALSDVRTAWPQVQDDIAAWCKDPVNRRWGYCAKKLSAK